MDMQIVVFYRLLDLFAQQVIVNERLGRFAGELHHHAGGRVGIHIGILAGDVVGFDIDDLQEHIACLGFAGDTALVAVSYVFCATSLRLLFISSNSTASWMASTVICESPLKEI